MRRSSARATLLGAVVLSAAFSGCASQPAESLLDEAPGVNPVVNLKTSFGTIQAEIYLEQVPVTAGNFLSLVESGFYDGLLFHRVVGPRAQPPSGFVIQTGDNLTRDPAKRELWGSGGSEVAIPDEFHAGLRHARAGLLSMANLYPVPNSGSSQFFITLASAPALDDRHAIFGSVLRGMEVVNRISLVPTGERDVPQTPIVLERATVLWPKGDAQGSASLAAYALDFTHPIAAGRSAGMAAVVRNQGNVRANVTAAVDPPPGFAGAVEPGASRFLLPSGQSRIVVLRVAPPADVENGTYTARLRAEIEGDPSKNLSLSFTLRTAEFGREFNATANSVVAHFTRLAEDGRIIDTTLRSVATSAFPKHSAFHGPSADDPQTLQRGRVIPGFADVLEGVRAGETRVARIPPETGYGYELDPSCFLPNPTIACALVARTFVVQLDVTAVR